MNYRRILGTLPVVTAVVLATIPVVGQGRERSLYVSVVDQAGVPVPNLGIPDFIVREDNVSREVLRVVPANEPMQIAVLIDNSMAAADAIFDIRRALPGFIDALSKPDPDRPAAKNQIAIVGLAERPTILSDYTSDRAQLIRATERIWEQSMSANYLLDALVEVTKGFKIREATRPVIVAITMASGAEYSTRRHEDVFDALRAANAPFHVVALGQPTLEANDHAQERDMVIGEGPKVSGGTRSQLLTSMALPTRLQQLANVLTHQYKVTYGHPDSLIPPERVAVSARRADLKASGTPVITSPQVRQ